MRKAANLLRQSYKHSQRSTADSIRAKTGTDCAAVRTYASDEAAQQSWMPGWLRSRLPGVLGGTREVDQLEDLDLDSYAAAMKRARQMGSLTGYVHGTSAISTPAAQGTFRLHETIIGNMTAEERKNLATFGRAERHRVAQSSSCTPDQVDDCIAKYQWMAHMTKQMAALKRAGKPVPKTIDEVEAQLGNWRSFKTQQAAPGQSKSAESSGAFSIPAESKGPKGQRCGLAGMAVSRNTKCPVTRKAYKACCGRQQIRAAA